MRNKQIVITGGAGFIGSALLRFLNDQGMTNIVLVDDLGTTEKWKNLVGKRFTQIIPIDKLFSWLEGRGSEIGAIFHLGACSSTLETNAQYLLENNVYYSQKLMTYAVKEGIRFIYASSAATYGDGSNGFSDDHAKLHSLKPLNMYGYSKHLVDLWALQEGFLDKVVGLKYFNIFGPNEYHKGPMTSALFKMVPQIQKEGVARLFKGNSEYADGEQLRDFLYVKDAVGMTAAFLDTKDAGIFNIGSGEASSWNFLAKALFAALGLPERIEYIDMPLALVGKYQNYTCADMHKFKGHVEPLAQAVRDYVQGYLLTEAIW